MTDVYPQSHADSHAQIQSERQPVMDMADMRRQLDRQQNTIDEAIRILCGDGPKLRVILDALTVLRSRND